MSGRGLLTVAAALAAALVAAPVAAEPPPGYPPEMLLPNAEAQGFLEGLEADPLEGDELDTIPAEISAPFDAFFAELMARGERLENWRNVGVDVEQAAAAHEGGLAANMTHAANEFGVQRTYFVDRPLESLLPLELKLVGRYGPTIEGEGVRIEIGQVSPRLLLAMRVQYRSEGNTRCQHRTETRLYSDPRIPATEADLMAFMVSMLLARRVDELGLCFGTEELEPGVYVTRAFDREGYRLPQMDEGQPRFRIVPLTPLPLTTPE